MDCGISYWVSSCWHGDSGILTDTAGYTGIWFVPAYWLIWSLKRRLTHPRIGYVKVARERKTMAWLAITGVVILLLGITGFFIAVTGERPPFLRNYFQFLFGTTLAVVTGLIGYWLRIVRWYVYTALMFVFVAFNQWLGLSFELSFIIPGGIIFLYGLIILFRFLRKYPRISEEGFDGKQ